MKDLLFLILLGLCISSCREYSKTNRSRHLLKAEYGVLDTLVIKNGLICANSGGLKIKPLEINRDSVLLVFFEAFKKLPCKVKFKNGKLYCNRRFIGYERLKYRLFDFSELESLADEEERHVLIPLINYNYIPTRNIYVTTTGAVGGGGFSKKVVLELVVLIFKDKKLVYFNSGLFNSPTVETSLSTDYIDSIIKQESIDSLVQLTMKDYIERLR